MQYKCQKTNNKCKNFNNFVSLWVENYMTLIRNNHLKICCYEKKQESVKKFMSETKSPPLKKNLVDVDNQIEDLKVKKKKTESEQNQ